MTDRPIIYSGVMVSALLSGRKTQTRRLASSPLAKCRPGDRLWVRESYLDIRPFRDAPVFASLTGDAAYMADCTFIGDHKWTPSIHMPRFASRLTLVVQEVRQQILGDISEADAQAEGVYGPIGGEWFTDQSSAVPHRSARSAFLGLWRDLHGRSDLNQTVVALTFSVHHANIDGAAA
jgi:hypothetical protein